MSMMASGSLAALLSLLLVATVSLTGAMAQGNATLGASAILAINNTLAVCPNSKWQDSPLLYKQPAPIGTFAGVMHWKGKQAVSYAKTRLLPGLYANMAFLAFTLITLVVLLFWRIGLCCASLFQLCCCPPAEDKGKTPEVILTSTLTWAYKLIMLILAVGTIIMCIYGMASAHKEILTPGWEVASSLITYFTSVSAALNALLAQIALIAPAMDRMTEIGTVEVQAGPFLNTYLPAMSAYLDFPSNNPSPLVTSLATLTSQLTLLTARTTAVITDTATTLPTLQTSAVSIETYGTAAYNSDVKTKLSSLAAAMTALSPTYNAGSTPGQITALQTAMTNAIVGTWNTNFQAVSAAVTLIASVNSATTALADISSLSSLLTAMSAITATGTAVTTFNTQAIAVRPTALWILNQTNYVNTTVVLLNATAIKTMDDMRALVTVLAAFNAQTPSAATLSSTLTTLSTSLHMPSSSTTTLQSYLTSLQTTLSACPATATSTTYLAGVTSALTALQTPYDTTATALASYVATGNQDQPHLDTLYNSIKPGASLTLAQCNLAVTATSAPPAQLTTSWVSSATSIDSTLTSASASRVSVNTAVSTMKTNGAAVPPLGSYSSNTAAVVTVYVPYATPNSADLLPLTVQISALSAATLQSPVAIKAAVLNAVSLFSDAAGKLTTLTVEKVTKFQDKWEPKTDPYITLRYQVTLGLYGLGLLFVLLVLIFGFVNCRLGLLIAILLLLILTFINFIMALLWAGVLVGEDDLCYNMEDVLVSVVPAKFSLLIAYYIWDYGGDVRAALASTGIVDINKIEAQALNANTQVYDVIDAAFKPRALMTGALNQIFNVTSGSINATNVVIDLAGYDSINPIYIAVKSFICCGVPDEFNTMWVAQTFGGVCALLTCWVALLVVHRLDILWRHGGCCGWRCMRPRLQWGSMQVSPDGQHHDEGFKPDRAPSQVGAMGESISGPHPPAPLNSLMSGPVQSAPSSDINRPLLDSPNPHADSAAGLPGTASDAANSAYQRQVDAFNASTQAYFPGSPVLRSAGSKSPPSAHDLSAKAPSPSREASVSRGNSNIMSSSGNRHTEGAEEVVADEAEAAPVGARQPDKVSDHALEEEDGARAPSVSGPRGGAELAEGAVSPQGAAPNRPNSLH